MHGDDLVVSGEPVHLVWLRDELGSKLEINTTILGDEPGMSKEVKLLNGSSVGTMESGYPMKQTGNTAEAIIRETGASNLTSLHISTSKESK